MADNARPMNKQQVNAALHEAVERRAFVRLVRSVESAPVDGAVVALAKDWVLVLVLDEGIRYGGFQAFRVRDISDVELPAPHAGFYRRAIRARGLRRPRAPRLDLSGTAELVLSAGRCFPLVTLHKEKGEPHVCHVGRPVLCSSASVALMEISPDAIWDEAPTVHRLAEITRVDVGGPYEEALTLAALPPESPPNAPRRRAPLPA